jgi:hypothetical protein
MKPAITVYIPTRNRAEMLRQALFSIAQQTCDPTLVRVVVADNASTDHTSATVNEFGQLNIEYLRRPADIGALRNWNGAAGFLETEYFQFLSDDDLLAPFHLDFSLRYLGSHPEVGVFGGGTQYGTGLFDKLLSSGDLRLGDSYVNWETGLCEWSRVAWLAAHSVASAVCINACLFRSAVLRGMGQLFDPETATLGDRWFMARVGASTVCVTTPWPTCLLREHSTNAVHGRWTKDMDEECQVVARRTLALAASVRTDIPAFWRDFLEKNPRRTDVRHRIFTHLPPDVCSEILGAWRPDRGRLDALGVPGVLKRNLRRARAWLLRLLMGQQGGR